MRSICSGGNYPASITNCRRLLVAGLLILLSACSQTANILSTEPSGNNTQGAQKLSSFTQFPDIPIPGGAKLIVDKTLVFGTKPWYGQLTIQSPGNPATMFDFYRNELPNYQWQEITSVRAPISILTYTRDERVLAISIRGETLGGTELTLTASPKGGGAIKPGTQ